jgi:hypothetical protein
MGAPSFARSVREGWESTNQPSRRKASINTKMGAPGLDFQTGDFSVGSYLSTQQ